MKYCTILWLPIINLHSPHVSGERLQLIQWPIDYVSKIHKNRSFYPQINPKWLRHSNPFGANSKGEVHQVNMRRLTPLTCLCVGDRPRVWIWLGSFSRKTGSGGKLLARLYPKEEKKRKRKRHTPINTCTAHGLSHWLHPSTGMQQQ